MAKLESKLRLRRRQRQQPPMSQADAAEAYIAAGARLVLLDQGKKPIRDDWPNLTIKDGKLWRVNPMAGIGLHHGPSGTCALDIDNYPLAATLFAERGLDLEALLNAGLRCTGNPTRAKAFYRVPEGVKLELHKVALALDKEKPKQRTTVFELRAGHGCQDVLPPSLHRPNRRYIWTDDTAGNIFNLSIDEWPEVPKELLAHWAAFNRGFWVPEWADKTATAYRKGTGLEDPELRTIAEVFNREVGLAEVLERNGYKPAGVGRWCSPLSTTGQAGVVEFTPGLVYDHHGSSLLAQERQHDHCVHDALDCMRILEQDNDWAASKDAALAELKQLGITVPLPTNEEDTAKLEDWVNEDLEQKSARLYQKAFIEDPPAPPMLIEGFVPCDAWGVVGPGGSGKTRIVMNLMVRMALGWPIFEDDKEPREPIKCVYVSGEDDSLRILYRLRVLCDGMMLNDAQRRLLAQNLIIEDWAGTARRLIRFDNKKRDLVVTSWAKGLIEKYRGEGIKWVHIDPTSNLGPGEQHGNDGMSLLMILGQRISRELGTGGVDRASVGFTHHVSKEVARRGVVDQHSGRGGAAFSDNGRGQLNMVVHKDERDGPMCPVHLDNPRDIEARRVIRIHVTKLNDDGFFEEPYWAVADERMPHFIRFHKPIRVEERAEVEANRERVQMRQLLRFVYHWNTATQGGPPTARKVAEAKDDKLGFGKHKREELINKARKEGLLEDAPLPKAQQHGRRKEALRVTETGQAYAFEP
jgi:hypothetical protein